MYVTSAYKFCRIPQEKLSLGFTIIRKWEREVRVWTPFEPVEGWGVSGPIWAAPPLHLCKTCHKLAENHRKLKEFVRKR